MEQREFIVEQETAGQRIDRFLSGEDTGLSRSALQALVAEGHVQCNGKTVAKSLETLAVGTLLDILHHDVAEFLKLVYHRRNDEIEHSTDDGKHEHQRHDNGQSSGGHMQFILHELHYRIHQICQQPSHEEWQEHAAQEIHRI